MINKVVIKSFFKYHLSINKMIRIVRELQKMNQNTIRGVLEKENKWSLG